jgi:UDP-N-acetylglucosamine--N-acetylmuramyl-(pentapeptide) pyrophosphoryl-undecaprenol N-acetylglucosamine transferase
MVLIPLTGSGTRGDQVENAFFFQRAGAAQALVGEDANPQKLIQTIKTLAQDSEKRNAMAQASAKFGERDGAGIIAKTLAEEIKKLAGGSN